MKTDGGLNENPARGFSVNDKLPRRGQCVGVVTSRYQCRGYLDSSGEWRDTSDGSVIQDVHSWFLTNADEVEFGRPLLT